MHMGVRFALCIASAWVLNGLCIERGNAWPAHGGASIETGSVQFVADTCWWWGTRWQFGWRGYGWYACWDEVKPSAPTAIAPEAVPDGAMLPESCVRSRRDKSGHLHSHNIC